ncbi:DNA/RNA helicase, superfamily II [Belliella baltica DSM 15883]|uniref:DNA/RNA helicase, superfamily II n=1 Tax=Belliella baltica (strain DSM 15883 / CIP 108006 / LMG 21964 / BA134) TaxID=866536 RepID=I3Z8F2_BELBD|nr:DEAD/DEAH box helicase [Belliella baltica]AFL85520.1 DNA/RNA helicase, superfamily II [Belliella baltica DSM 15883]
MNFNSFNFEASLQEGLDAMGFEKPTPVQEMAIPIILEGRDIIACAQTGTGKTAAFILPVLNKIAKSGENKLNTLVLAPTRELAIQIDQQIQGFAYFLGISSIPIYGGGDGLVWEQQKRALEQGAEIVVATPGRLIALLAGGKINLDSLQHLILDEADRMLDMGFSDDLLTIVNYLPKNRQTILFSATMPPKIRQFSKKLLNNPEEISLSLGKTAEGVTQTAYLAYDTQKEDLVKHILRQKDYEAVIIFASTKDKVKSLFKVLKKDFEVEAFHSDLEQVEREQIMSRFKNRNLRILVGTDIISRGIDVVGIELVINFDTPNDPEDYVHRVGRTARADSKGEAITFINEKDKFKFNNIEKLIGMEIEKVPLPEGFESGPSYSASSSSNSRGDFKKEKKSSSSGYKKSNQPKTEQKPNRRPRENTAQSHVVRDPENPDTPSGFKPRQNPKVEKSPEFQEKPTTSKYGTRKNVID